MITFPGEAQVHNTQEMSELTMLKTYCKLSSYLTCHFLQKVFTRNHTSLATWSTDLFKHHLVEHQKMTEITTERREWIWQAHSSVVCLDSCLETLSMTWSSI